MLDQRISSLPSIDSIGEVAQVVLVALKLGDSRLVRYIRSCLDQLGAQHDVLLADLGILQLVLRNGKRTGPVLLDSRRFLL